MVVMLVVLCLSFTTLVLALPLMPDLVRACDAYVAVA